MRIHRKLMVLVGFGMLSIAAITVLSLQYLTGMFSDSTRQMGGITIESQRIWVLERKIEDLSRAIQNYVESGDRSFIGEYERALTEVREAEKTVSVQDRNSNGQDMVRTLTGDLDDMNAKTQQVFLLRSPGREERVQAGRLLAEIADLQAGIKKNIFHYQEANAAEMRRVLAQLNRNKAAINLVFPAILLTSIGSLIAFAWYVHRKISSPLNELWAGTEEISRGNLDYRTPVRGESDMAMLAERFNEMARRLNASYAELEQKLYERTHELASLDAVALTLSKAGSLKDMLDKSLLRILDSLAGIEPKGGVFLCEPGGQVMRLMTQKGLSPDFVEEEGVIRMGECLCGIVAQTGELLYSEHGCTDERHTRKNDNHHPHAHIIIPIKSRGIVHGVVFLYPQKDFKLKPSDIQMLDAIGAQLGMAVENFRFYAEVKESSEKYWDLFENSTDILFTVDRSGNLTAVNKAAELFSGYSKVELSGKSIFDFLSPQERSARKTLAVAAIDGRQWTEFEVVKRDGTRAFIEVSARKMYNNQQEQGYQVSARDVTEQKRLRERLVQAERLGAIGQLGVAVRHEINNPLTTVIGNTELLMERYEGRDRELTARLENILNNALRIADIVKKLQAIKKDQVVEYLEGVKMTDLKQK